MQPWLEASAERTALLESLADARFKDQHDQALLSASIAAAQAIRMLGGGGLMHKHTYAVCRLRVGRAAVSARAPLKWV